MSCRKKLKELTIKDNFMFGAVMSMEDNCRQFLELVMKLRIGEICISSEKSILFHPEYRGVRLDVYAVDDRNSHYNVEMQVIRRAELSKRARYYHSQMDMELLRPGNDYAELPDTYVIFICDFDPFDQGLYCYTFENNCVENGILKLNEGCRSIFLSTCGRVRQGVSEGLVQFLRFVKADLRESQEEFENDFVKQLQASVKKVKSSREMEERFMVLEEMLKDERAEGINQGITQGIARGTAESLLGLLEAKGTVPEELKNKVLSEPDLDCLRTWHRIAIHASSVQQFMAEIQAVK